MNEYTNYLVGIALLMLVVSPPLVPAAIAGIRAVLNWRQTIARLRHVAPALALRPAF